MTRYDIDQIINDFLRDAQYRVGELTIQMDKSDDKGDYPYEQMRKVRAELIMFMGIIWWSYDEIKDGYNFLYASLPNSSNYWTERELVLEIEYLRNRASLNNVPYLSFTNHLTELVTGNLQVQGAGLPIGHFGQYITYNVAGDPIAADFPVYGGMNIYEDINSYFAGRP
jgi:hypothetical protein